ncbi:MAG: DNA internalization-related competence protein ComEC/Rec2 [Candidatus Marinimicrobia bacterium]|nr:DNA internalization-related competence protein ComEC/Rec2 [Candidatus Neomarinimicrobiota bacterium]
MRIKSKIISFPFAFILGAFLVGIFANWLPVWASIILLIIELIILIRWRNVYIVGFFILMLLGFTQTKIRQSTIQHHKDSAIALNESVITVNGSVIEVVKREKGFRIRLDNPIIYLDSIKIIFPSILLFTESNQEIKVGMTISTMGQFNAIQGARNPGEFDYRKFYARKGIYGRCYVEDGVMIEILDSNINIIQRTQNNIRTLFQNKIGENYGLITALILGDKSSVDAEVRENFTDTGVIHVLAVSGLHVGYVLIILIMIGKILRFPWGWDRLLIIFGLIFFCFLTGGKPSVIRASLMAGLYVLTPILNRQGNLWNTIFFSAFLILLFDPLYIYDLGFIFSYTAVLSIVIFYQLIESILPEKLKISSIKSKPVRFIYGLFIVSLSAQIGTLPITAFYFGRIPIISLVANVFIVPIVGILVAIGFCIIFFGWIPILGGLFGQSAWFVTNLISYLAEFFSDFPFAFIEMPHFSLIWILIYFIFISIPFLFLIPKFKKFALFPGLVIIAILTWNYGGSLKYLDIIYLDVGQGDAILLRMPNNKTMLIDGGQKFGKRDYGELVVNPVLQYMGIDRINWLVMTHPHSDHIGGLITVAKSFPVDTVFDTYLDYDSWTYKTLKSKLIERNALVDKPSPGEIRFLDNNLAIEFFSPDSEFVNNSSNINNSSIVMKLVYGETSFLFTGDLELEGEYELTQYGEMLRSNVLKVGHHGSKTSSSDGFLKLVNPEIAVVSVGYRNKFRHPSNDVLERISQYAEKIHRTDQSGALWLRSNGSEIWEVSWK